MWYHSDVFFCWSSFYQGRHEKQPPMSRCTNNLWTQASRPFTHFPQIEGLAQVRHTIVTMQWMRCYYHCLCFFAQSSSRSELRGKSNTAEAWWETSKSRDRRSSGYYLAQLTCYTVNLFITAFVRDCPSILKKETLLLSRVGYSFVGYLQLFLKLLPIWTWTPVISKLGSHYDPLKQTMSTPLRRPSNS